MIHTSHRSEVCCDPVPDSANRRICGRNLGTLSRTDLARILHEQCEVEVFGSGATNRDSRVCMGSMIGCSGTIGRISDAPPPTPVVCQRAGAALGGVRRCPGERPPYGTTPGADRHCLAAAGCGGYYAAPPHRSATESGRMRFGLATASAVLPSARRRSPSISV